MSPVPPVIFSDSFFRMYRVYIRKLFLKLTGVVELRPAGAVRGWVLLSFVTHPFTIKKEILLKAPHTTPWECMGIAEILLERGFGVDVIEWTNTAFVPKKEYKMVIDIHQNLERLSPYLPKECVKIYYATGAHWAYQNKAEQGRLEEFKERRGVALAPRRQVTPSRNSAYADYVTVLGNGFAKDTYAFAGKEITLIPLLSTVTFPSPKDKSFERIRRNFVWIGGGGAVHKGLDRILECFASLPEYQLTVCGPVGAEKDFEDFYHKELYETKNIKLVGRIDVRGEQFKEIVDNAVGLVYASSSEGQAGSVIVGLHAGLIPIVTNESGVDVVPFGIRLAMGSLEEIRTAVIRVSELPVEELQKRSVAAWEYARAHHTKETYKAAYAAFIDTAIREKNL